MCEQAVVRTSLVAEHVLDAERKTFERARLAGPETSVGRLRHRARALRRLQNKGVERARLLHDGNVRIGQLDGGEFSSA